MDSTLLEGDRRWFVKNTGALVVAAAVLPRGLAEAAVSPDLTDAALDCSKAGEACLAHCMAAFVAGDTALAHCASSVQQMVVGCDAVAKLASQGSSHLAAFVAPCKDLCSDCEAECRKHAATHEVCKQCADACARFIKAAATVRS